MRNRALLATGVVLAALVPVVAGAAMSAPDGSTLTRSSRSIVAIRSDECSGPDRVGSGFLWEAADRVGTALHVVAGCNRITVRSPASGALSRASVLKVSKAADLALLQVEQPYANVAVLTESMHGPSVDDVFKALGFALGTPTHSDVTLRVAYGSTTLRDMLPQSVRDELQSAGSPSLTISVLRLDGHLLPGLSGAPILDADGKVVGVGDGGLQHGAASISFGIPVSYVTELVRSGTPGTAAVGLSAAHFSADVGSTGGTEVTCGEFRFRRARTATFDDLVTTSDDPFGARQLMMAAPTVNASALRFAIYENADTGAVVVVPEGMSLRASGDRCVAEAAGGKIVVKVGSAKVDSPMMVQTRSLEFEGKINQDHPGYYWQINPAFSYWRPLMRPDGLTATRKSVMGGAWGQPPGVVFFETLMTRGSAFIGIAGFNFLYRPEVDWDLACSTPACQSYRPHLNTWVATVLGIHFSTFPAR